MSKKVQKTAIYEWLLAVTKLVVSGIQCTSLS